MKFSSRKGQQFVIQGGILLILFIMPVWLRVANAPKSFSRDYVLGFVWVIPLIFTLTMWVLSGFWGIKTIITSRRRTIFAFAILGLALWAALSTTWAFMRDSRPDMTWGVVGSMGLMALFAVMTLACAPHPRWVTLALMLGMVAHGSIGALQVGMQHDIGLRVLGEFRLDPRIGGISVVQAGDIRWLRPYGLTPHPNPYAGYLMVGVLCALVWAIIPAHRQHTPRDVNIAPVVGLRQIVATGWVLMLGITLLFGIYVLWLSFSRGAWLGFATAVMGMMVIYTITRRWTKPLIWRGMWLMGAITFMAVIFVGLYHPFLFARAGMSDEYVESRAINERAIHLSIAYAAFEKSPALGVGIGNFAWYATYYLRYTLRVDMKGDNIHNVYLLALTELGIIGLMLLLAGLFASISHIPADPHRLALWGAVVALAVVGLFDHYTWSMLAYGGLWWGLMGVVLHPHNG
jgi:O-antigen ligase